MSSDIEIPETTLQGAQDAPQEARPRRKRGRAPGMPKVPGSGRQKGTPNIDLATLTAKAERLAIDIMDGTQFVEIGPTGKTIKRSASIEQRVRTMLALLDKKYSDKSSTELTGADGSPLYPKAPEEHNPRDVARAVLSLLREAEIEDDGQHAAFAGPGEALVRVRDPDLAARILPDTGPADAPQVNESEVFDNGATIQLVEIQTGRSHDSSVPPITKWEVRDRHGEVHSLKRERADAEALARSLP